MLSALLAAFAMGAATGPSLHRPTEAQEQPRAAIIRDVVFGTGGSRSLRMDIVRPEPTPREPVPVIVWVHGGAWMSGSRADGLRFLPAWAQRGYLCASIEYRLSQEAAFPAQIEDCKCAIRYLRAHARELGIDPERIGVWGSSSGGHLAALLGTTGGVRGLEGRGGWQGHSSRVQAVCDWYGPTDFLQMGLFPSVVKHDAPDSPESRLLGGPLLANRDRAARANPIAYIGRGTPAHDIPPFLIMHGDRDRTVPPNQSELLFTALRKANVPSEMYIVSGSGHGFAGPTIDAMVDAFFTRWLKHPPAPDGGRPPSPSRTGSRRTAPARRLSGGEARGGA